MIYETTLTIPDDVEVDIEYSFDAYGFALENAMIGGQRLDIDRLFMKKDEKLVSLAQYLQDKLSEKSDELEEEIKNSYDGD